MLILLVLFPFLSLAEDMASEKYCFHSHPALQSAMAKFQAIQVNSDKVTADENCLIVQMRPHRRELIQRYILSAVPGARVDFSSAEITRELCKLKVEKIKNTSTDSTRTGLNQRPSFDHSNTVENATEVMSIDTLDDFHFMVDQNEIKGKCRYITPDRYDLLIEVKTNPKPIVPSNLPPDSIVVIKTPPPDQETMVLKTELQLLRGERKEIGEIVRKIKDKDRSINISPSLKIENQQQNSVEKVFLSLQ